MTESRTRLTRMPSAMGLTARLAWARAREHGIAVRPLVKAAGLSIEQLEDSRSRLPVSNQITFLNLVADALDDDMLGLQLALDLDLRRAGLFYYVLASSDTLMEVFERGARFTSIVNEGVVQQCVRGRRIGLALNYNGVRRRDDQHQIEFWVVALLRIGRQVSGRHLKPTLVRFTHRRPNGHARLARFLGCELEFGATHDQILFARELASLKIVQADPYLNRLLLEMCEEALARQRRATGTFAARVENAVVPLLPHGQARASRIASEFGMSERTFARRLADEGETFTQLLERLRLDLARRYLRDGELSISRVAWLLGYQEVGAFSHAFRRWTGQSPSTVAAHAR